MLHPNVPNPFNPETTIRYELAEVSSGSTIAQEMGVRLAIYNSAGQLVRVVVDDVQRVGHYVVSWDGRDDRGLDVKQRCVSVPARSRRLRAGSAHAAGQVKCLNLTVTLGIASLTPWDGMLDAG